MKNPVTTITGIIMLIAAVLTATGVLTPEQQTGVGEYGTAIVEAVVGLIAIFKAGDKGGV